MMQFTTPTACECEHVAHTEREGRTSNGNPGHRYGAKFLQLVAVKTNMGTFKVCPDCAGDCLREEAL